MIFDLNKCTEGNHVSHWGQHHEFNQPEDIGGNCRGMPYGDKDKHTCLCGKVWQTEPVLNLKIKVGTMIHKILGDNPIDTDYRLIENRLGAFDT